MSRWAESALSWWVEAGVDTIVGEQPRDWLAGAKVVGKAAEPTELSSAAPAEAFPGDLSAFQAWLAASDAIPFASASTRRLAPAGDPAAGLMAITDVPAVEDLAADRLFNGEAGALLDRMLAAIGRSRQTIYLAPFAPIPPPAGRIDREGVDFLTRVMRHHIGLVSPRALLIFGDACARALLGINMTQARGRWHDVETPNGPVRAVVTIRPQEVLKQRNHRTEAWADLQLLMEGLKP